MNPLLDGVLFAETFGTAEMRAVFDEDAFLARFQEVEAALARAEADAGLVPAEAAAAITRTASADYLDQDRIAENVEEMGLFSMSIIEAWRAELGPHGEYLHWGASTQDISDTTLVLQLREAHEILLSDLVSVRDQLADLAEDYRSTPMVGRTQYANGPPVTFGLKAATWVDELDRHICRLDEVARRLFVVQLFGASGTLAALDEAGFEVIESFAAELDLDVPDVGWTATRDRFAEFLNVLAMISGTLSRIARELLFLNRPEIDEVEETIPGAEVGSSTNPHKRNPVYSQHNVGLARLVRSHADTMNELTEPMGERDRSTWYVEFAVIPDSCCYLARMLENTKRNLADLTVNPERMERNLDRAGALVASEAVMMALATEVGRQTAHEIVHDRAMQAVRDGREFRRCLRDDDRVTEHLTDEQIAALTTPLNYLGLAEELVDNVLGVDSRKDGDQ